MYPHTACPSLDRHTDRSFSRSLPPVSRRTVSTLFSSLCLIGAACAFPSTGAAQHYKQTNLISDVAGVAPTTDTNLVNPWGLSRSATSPWWVADNGNGLSTLNDGAGAKLALVVTIPSAAGGTVWGSPTGTVANSSADFALAAGQPARFLFVTEDGTVSGWNPTTDATHAVIKVNNSGKAVYKGMTLGQRAGANFIYAANFHAGTIDLFDKNFAPVTLPAGAFVDPRVPKGYAPFNVESLGGKIAVAYAKQDKAMIDHVDGPGRGFVTLFDTDGKLLLRLRSGHWMNAPWGLALAPADFGKFSNSILVGQFGSGHIVAFDPVTGKIRGWLRGEGRRPLSIDGLWALSFGNGAGAGPVNTLYFTAGIKDQTHGLLGTITPIATPPAAAHAEDENELDGD